MIEGHQDLAARLESRVDVQSLADWKTAAAGRAQTGALPDPKVEMRDVQLRPNASDDELTKGQSVGSRDYRSRKSTSTGQNARKREEERLTN